MRPRIKTAFWFAMFLLIFTGSVSAEIFFGPELYYRTKGGPDIYTDNFDASVGEAILRVSNGDPDGGSRVSSASVYLNENLLVKRENFKQGTHVVFEEAVDLAAVNDIRVELRGAPESFVTIDVFRPGLSVRINCIPDSIYAGQDAVLSWTSNHADSVHIDNGIGYVDLAGSLTVSPDATTTYTVTAAGPEGSVTDQVTLQVLTSPAPEIVFSASATEIAPGESATLTWTTLHADTCELAPGFGPVALNGSESVTPEHTTTYTLTATGPGGTASDSVTVTVTSIPAPIAAFTANPEIIIIGESSTLAWSTQNADNVSIDQGIGTVAATGSTTVSPGETITYTLTATGPGGTATKSATVTVNPIPEPTVAIAADPASIIIGESAILAWSSAHAADAVIDQGIGTVPLNGSTTVSPTETTIYTITVTGPGGTATDSVTVSVSPPPSPTVSISASPSTITYGESSQLSWYSEYADSCSISPGIGTVALNGSRAVSPAATTIYTITAIGPGGMATDQAQVTVQADVEPQPEGSFGSRYEDLIPPDATLPAYDAKRFSLVNGRVVDVSDLPIAGVAVTILHHPEYGTVLTDAAGGFALPVEGGEVLTVAYTRDGLITAHRKIEVPWNGIATVDPIVMIPVDANATAIVFDGDPAGVQTHRSTPVTDEFGTRSCTLVFTGDNRAYGVDANGDILQELDRITVRATEFETPVSMPAVLPPTTAYTYCAELSADEALQVEFARPVIMWVENFLGFAVGDVVPVGYYDRNQGVWVPSANGIVVRLLDMNNDGIVDAMDATGDGLPDDLDNDGTTSNEVQGLDDPLAYPPGATFWRVELMHFTPWDCNWSYGPPPGATEPDPEGQVTVDMQEDPPNCETGVGSFVADRSRVLHEDIPIAGTDMTLHYAANRVEGYRSVIRVPASGQSVPAVLKRIEVYLKIAGRTFQETLEPLPDQMAVFHWDGVDFRGDSFCGPKIKGKTWVGYVYDAFYYESRNEFAESFGQTGANVTPIPSRQEVISWRIENIEVDRDCPDVIAEGWTLSPHHRFYPMDMRRIFKGDGATGFYSPGVLGLFAGSITPGYAGDDGPAVQARLNNPSGIAADGKGNVYIADTDNHRIRKVDVDGVITTIAGDGVAGFAGDDGPAVSGRLNSPWGVAADSEGNVYIADTHNHSIRMVAPNGILYTIAGIGWAGYGGDEGFAREAMLNSPRGVAVDGHGNILIVDTNNHRIRRVDISGGIVTVAGNGMSGFSGEGVLATDARINLPSAVAVDTEGNLFIADTHNNRIRKVNVQGIIATFAGDGTIGVKTGVPPKEGWVARPQGIGVDPEGRVLFSVTYPGYFAAVFETGASEIGALVSGEGQAYHDPSGEVYIIKNGNQHVATTDAHTHIPLYYFSYDADNRLVSIFDRAQNRTRIERDAAGVPLAVVSPYGVRTELTLDAQNRLTEVRYPDGGRYFFEYSAGGLLTTKTDPMGNRFERTFDADGRITVANDPEGGRWQYQVAERADGTIRTELTTAEGQQTVYLDRILPSGEFTSRITGPSGTVADYRKSEDGRIVQKALSCGGDLMVEYALDPGYRYSYAKIQTLTQPSGLARTVVEERLYEDVDNDKIHDKVHTTIAINDKPFTFLTDGTQNQKLLVTPEGRSMGWGYDPDTGLTTWAHTPGLLDTAFTYDARGRLITATTGTRQVSRSYDAAGNLATITDPQNRVTVFDYDAMGRMTDMRRPDGSRIQFTYDPNGNLTVLTNPNLVDHGFGYNGVNRQTSYETPLSGGYAYIYDRDRRLIRTVFPSAKEIQYLYDVQYPGRLARIQTPEGNIDYAYYPCAGKIQSITGHNETIAYGYDGSLVTTETFSGTLNTALAYGYNPDFDLASIAYAGGAETLTYDHDGLLIGAGRFAIARNAANGLPESVTGDAFVLSRTFTGYGEIRTQAVAVGGQHLSAWDLTVDNAGRIASKTETVDGVLTHYAYAYDDLGRLRTVSKDGVMVEEYRYNANGSRIYEMNALRGISGRDLTYSGEDHLLTAGETVYAYDLDGFLQSRTDGSETTTYEYSSRGELLSVTLPDGTVIGYLHDPLGRRIAKQVNGVTVEKYLWAGRTRLLAIYDGADNLKMRFEYADGRLPYAVTMGGSVYYLAYDQVGSLRAVADAAGNVVKEVIYDAFGNVLSDTNPAFAIPFGFAGGLHDRDTGLVRFGYRDYDPETGRWTAKDPIGFAGGDTDLYGYCLNDPVNFVDPLGLDGAGRRIITQGLVGALRGAITGAIVGTPTGVSEMNPSKAPNPANGGRFRRSNL